MFREIWPTPSKLRFSHWLLRTGLICPISAPTSPHSSLLFLCHLRFRHILVCGPPGPAAWDALLLGPQMTGSLSPFEGNLCESSSNPAFLDHPSNAAIPCFFLCPFLLYFSLEHSSLPNKGHVLPIYFAYSLTLSPLEWNLHEDRVFICLWTMSYSALNID